MNEDGYNVPMFSQNIPASSAKYPNVQTVLITLGI